MSTNDNGIGYQSGFGNQFSSEAIAGTLPIGQNSPQRVAHGLYAELFSGTAFTMPRHESRRTWMYRIRPSASHPTFKAIPSPIPEGALAPANPNRMRWDALEVPAEPTDFVDGLRAMVANSSLDHPSGITIFHYVANRSMERAFYNADGELLIVPQLGKLLLVTELGRIELQPLEIAVIPRGMKFKVELLGSAARGYIAENHGAPLRLPDLGPIGSNGLANPRDFLTPNAWFESEQSPTQLVQKFQGSFWEAELDHSPFDVVAWHGNNVPYKYDLRHFNTIGSISFDHPDPSIFTVLTSPTSVAGLANLDFVIFPPRWLVAENTFRPPWFHRNLMNEYMGLIEGEYDAKADGFTPGGSSLHSCMSAHGPDAKTSERAMAANLEPEKLDGTMAFMFETHQVLRPTKFALASPALQGNYDACWEGIAGKFESTNS
ncbi:MAG: homogentisate 1,2-dioxygenase [Candidatus Pseudomonas phytovorans]|uniref:Homogentisate 1,2-dioxygenase n=1 Tax=Candidatus Pseudomonas phytovorans TaxID=3121377 RepID=A0AAJ6BAA2_9PSED|nr:homogentisate 1,2-dioxygenase [Pseudomonas sp.]WEK28504.1 MAG: homogentisate 1,2-dioxygenase [Pseudomonas sp.]